MPIFAAFFGALFSALGTFIAKIFAVKVSLRLIGVTAIIGLWTAALSFFNSQLAPLISSAFNTQYGQLLGLVFPPIAGTCIMVMIGALGYVQVYKLKRRFIEQTTGI
jgi:Family of unknown function (DUF5455)